MGQLAFSVFTQSSVAANAVSRDGVQPFQTLRLCSSREEDAGVCRRGPTARRRRQIGFSPVKCKLVAATSSYLRSNFPLVRDTTRWRLSLIARRSGPPFVRTSAAATKTGAIIGEMTGDAAEREAI